MKEVVFSCLIVLMISVCLGSAHEYHTRSKNELPDNTEQERDTNEETWIAKHTSNGCEYNEIVLECPHYERMVVDRAIYGQKVERCTMFHPGVTPCGRHAENPIKTQCDGQHRCQFMVGNDLFRDACFGHDKDLEVNYTCWDNRAGDGTITVFACEGSRLVVDCPKGKNVQILSAIWGRQSQHKCNPRMMNDQVTPFNTGCSLDVTSTMRRNCNGKNTCEELATNEKLTDPCVSNSKYLEVKYRCNTAEDKWKSKHSTVGCENGEIVVECPHFERIEVTKAIYSRQEDQCTLVVYPVMPRCSMNVEDAVKTQCDGQHRCQFPVVTDLFARDYCFPPYGKSLKVWFTCWGDRGDETITRYACEGSRLVLDCRTGNTIQILSAIWGRQTVDKCHPRKMNDIFSTFNTGCSFDLKYEMGLNCNGKNRCEALATKQKLSDPCMFNSVYFEVKYRCENTECRYC